MNTNRRTILSTTLPCNAVCAEVGVAWGEYTYHILRRANPKQLHLFDIWTGIDVPGTHISDEAARGRLSRLEQQFAQNFRSGQLVLHQGYIADTLPMVPDRFFDWIYLGAECSAVAAKEDLEVCARKVKLNGFMVRQDYVLLSQKDQVKYYWPGLSDAVDRFCESYGWEIVCVTDIIDSGNHAPEWARKYGLDPGGDAVPCCVMRRKV